MRVVRKSQVSTGLLGSCGASHRICHTQSAAAQQRSKGSSRGCAAGLLHARLSHSRNDGSSGLHLAGATEFDVSHISTSGLDSGGPCHRIFHSQPAARRRPSDITNRTRDEAVGNGKEAQKVGATNSHKQQQQIQTEKKADSEVDNEQTPSPIRAPPIKTVQSVLQVSAATQKTRPLASKQMIDHLVILLVCYQPLHKQLANSLLSCSVQHTEFRSAGGEEGSEYRQAAPMMASGLSVSARSTISG